MPDLVRLVDDVKQTKEPKILKQGSIPVAMIVPMATAEQRHKTIEKFDAKPLAEIKASLLQAGYPDTEVNDMLEAMSELPEYAGHGIQKSQ